MARGTEACPAGGDPRLVGDPVDTLTGAVVDQMLDFRLTGPIELRWYRHYDSSQSHRLLALGHGFTHEYDRRLLATAEGLVYEGPVGRQVVFPRLHTDAEECARGGMVLRREALRRYTVLRHGEPAMEFEFQAPHAQARLGRLVQGNHEVRFHYDLDHRLLGLTDSTGRRVVATEADDGRLLALTLNPSHDHPGGLLMAYGYDDDGNLVFTRDGGGHGYAFAYDHANRMVLRRGRKGFRFRFRYDEQGRCSAALGDGRLHGVVLDYKVPGRLTRVVRPDLGAWTYIFAAAGELSEIRDPLHGVRKFVRNAAGQASMELDPNGNVSRFSYDMAGSALARTDSLGRRWALPEDPNAPARLNPRVPGNAAEYEYGQLVDPEAIGLPSPRQAGALPLPSHVRALIATRNMQATATGQDAAGYRVRPLGALWWPAPARGRKFSALGKLVEQFDDVGRTRRWTYDASGNLAEYFDFDGATWRHDHGAWHFLQCTVSPVGAEARFSYTTSGEVASFEDAGGAISTYRYDLRDRLSAVERHGVVRETYVRDAAGNLVAKHAADGRELLRLDIGPGNLPTKRYLASGDEHQLQYDASGRVLMASTRKDAVQISYDGLGQRACDKRNGLGVAQRFSGWNALAESLWFDRFAVTYRKGPDGALRVTDPAGQVHGVRVLAHGVVERRFSNGSCETAQYDSLGRCLFKSVDRPAARTWTRHCEWSGEGELLRVQDSRHGEIRHAYDAAHRLRRRDVDGRCEDYVFDLADNLIEQPGLSDVQLLPGNRLLKANGERFVFNDRNHVQSRQTPEGVVRYHYDSRDQLVRIDLPAGTWEAEYDALGRRTRKHWQGRCTAYYWNADQLVAEVDADGRVRLYVYIDPLAQTPLLIVDCDAMDSPATNCRRYAVFADQLGTPCLIEDEQGREAWSARVAPFGKAEVSGKAVIQCNLRFPGHYLDVETGLHYNRFRYYDPVLGRYLQSDPWGIAGGNNLYAYVCNPLVVADVRGLGDESGKAKNRDEDEEGTAKPTRQELSKEDQLRAEMGALAQDAWGKMKEANERGDRTVKLADGTVLKTLNSTMGPCLSVVKDTKTGQVFYGQNTGEAPVGLHPPLDERARTVAATNQAKSPSPYEAHPGWTRDKGIPGSHSEVQAVNKGLGGRPDAEMGDFAVYNVRTKDNESGNAGDPMPRCDNCKPITDGVIPLTD